MKKVIRLTEKELNNIVYNTTRQVLNEGASGDVLGGLGDIVGGLISLIGGNKVTDHPKLLRILKSVGITPAAANTEGVKRGMRQKLVKIVTEKYGQVLETNCKEFNDSLIGIINGGSDPSGRFAEIDDDDTATVCPEFYNDCVRLVNSNCDFIESWSYDNNHQVSKAKPIPITRRRTKAERQEDKERVSGLLERYIGTLDHKFENFKRCAIACYNKIKTVFKPSRYLDQNTIYEVVSEYAKNFNYVSQMYRQLKTDWMDS